MLCLLRRFIIASKFDYFVIHETHVQSTADVIDNTSQQQFMFKCFVNFILAKHLVQFAFELISIEIAFV